MADAPIARRRSRALGKDIQQVGLPGANFRDAYHYFLKASWWSVLGYFVVLYLSLNLVFAVAFWLSGGISNTRPDSLVDAYNFSVQTLGTIGYGSMYPTTPLAHVIVTVESMTGILFIAVVTGLVFAKFSIPAARVMFSEVAVVSLVEGHPTLMFRAANQRGNQVVEAQLTVALLRRETTPEGQTLFRMRDVSLVRAKSPAFARTWMAMHRIDQQSPLKDLFPGTVGNLDFELVVNLVGLDSTSSQTIHANHSYLADEIRWGARFMDMMIPTADGRMTLDYHFFHKIEATAPGPNFPFPPLPATPG